MVSFSQFCLFFFFTEFRKIAALLFDVSNQFSSANLCIYTASIIYRHSRAIESNNATKLANPVLDEEKPTTEPSGSKNFFIYFMDGSN